MLNGSMIIEKITNSNGTAIKFEDGTMIYYGKISKQVSPGDNDTPITLPASFSNTNYIVNCSRSAGSYFTEYKLGKNFSKADIIKSLDEECNKILSNIPKNSYVISL